MTQELATTAPCEVAQAISPADMLAGIYRLASDPSTDVAKMTALMELFTKEQDRQAKAEFNRAMVACQAEMPRVNKNAQVINHKTGAIQSRYATFDHIDSIAREIYQAHGFSVSYGTGGTENGKYIVTATVRHAAGHSEEYRIPLALDQSGAKNDTQGMGSTVSYGKRYLLCMIFNITIEGEDKDGSTAPEPTITQEQADDLQVLIESRGLNLDKAKESIGVAVGRPITKLTEIPARLYKLVQAALASKGAK